jgi:hypothetical protein
MRGASITGIGTVPYYSGNASIPAGRFKNLRLSIRRLSFANFGRRRNGADRPHGEDLLQPHFPAARLAPSTCATTCWARHASIASSTPPIPSTVTLDTGRVSPRKQQHPVLEHDLHCSRSQPRTFRYGIARRTVSLSAQALWVLSARTAPYERSSGPSSTATPPS